jgi:hypothetical protein
MNIGKGYIPLPRTLVIKETSVGITYSFVMSRLTCHIQFGEVKINLTINDQIKCLDNKKVLFH